MSVTEDYKIPLVFPNMVVKCRPGAQNSTFLRNLFGLCMWGHISNGYCCMTKSDLRNDVKISVLYATTDLSHQAHPELFKSLMSRGKKLKPNVFCSLCSNSCHYKTQGTYNLNKTDCNGMYIERVELLDHVRFLWGGE